MGWTAHWRYMSQRKMWPVPMLSVLVGTGDLSVPAGNNGCLGPWRRRTAGGRPRAYRFPDRRRARRSDSTAGRLLGGIFGGASEQGIGVDVGGTASAPSFRLDPTAVASLLESGIGGALNAGSADKRDAKPPIKPNKKDLLDSLLHGGTHCSAPIPLPWSIWT